MRIARMNKRITLQGVTRTADGYGGFSETLTDVATVWAGVRPLVGTQRLEAAQTGLQRPHEFRMRYRTGVGGATRILYDSRRFDITSIVDVFEGHRELVIMAEEVD